MGVEVHEECQNLVGTAKKLWVLMKRLCRECGEL